MMKLKFRDNEYYVGRSDHTWYTFVKRVPQDISISLMDVDGSDVLSQDIIYPAGVKDVAFVGLYHEGDEHDGYLLRFVPQRSDHYSVTPVTPEDNIYFIVDVKELESLLGVNGAAAVESILTSNLEYDVRTRRRAAHASSALQWMKDWTGPFEIRLVRIIE